MDWGLQSYFRVLYALTLTASGASWSRRAAFLLPGSGGVAVAAGALSLAIGIDIGYRGLESGFHDLADVGYQLLALVFVVGILVTELGFRAPAASR